jgi:A/G-specific adenine glycosylase
LLSWFDRHARDLPWRQDPTPYRVWVSEIMLQQTQVATVIAYYHRFLQAFPTVQHLAEADPEHLLSLWEGLGYYRRARSMHAAAQRIMSQHGGVFPGAAEIREARSRFRSRQDSSRRRSPLEFVA